LSSWHGVLPARGRIPHRSGAIALDLTHAARPLWKVPSKTRRQALCSRCKHYQEKQHALAKEAKLSAAATCAPSRLQSLEVQSRKQRRVSDPDPQHLQQAIELIDLDTLELNELNDSAPDKTDNAATHRGGIHRTTEPEVDAAMEENVVLDFDGLEVELDGLNDSAPDKTDKFGDNAATHRGGIHRTTCTEPEVDAAMEGNVMLDFDGLDGYHPLPSPQTGNVELNVRDSAKNPRKVTHHTRRARPPSTGRSFLTQPPPPNLHPPTSR